MRCSFFPAATSQGLPSPILNSTSHSTHQPAAIHLPSSTRQQHTPSLQSMSGQMPSYHDSSQQAEQLDGTDHAKGSTTIEGTQSGANEESAAAVPTAEETVDWVDIYGGEALTMTFPITFSPAPICFDTSISFIRPNNRSRLPSTQSTQQNEADQSSTHLGKTEPETQPVSAIQLPRSAEVANILKKAGLARRDREAISRIFDMKRDPETETTLRVAAEQVSRVEGPAATTVVAFKHTLDLNGIANTQRFSAYDDDYVRDSVLDQYSKRLTGLGSAAWDGEATEEKRAAVLDSLQKLAVDIDSAIDWFKIGLEQ